MLVRRAACTAHKTAPSGYILQNIDRNHLNAAELLLSDAGVAALSTSLSRRLVTLDLSNNGVSDSGAKAFALCLARSSLTKVDLSRVSRAPIMCHGMNVTRRTLNFARAFSNSSLRFLYAHYRTRLGTRGGCRLLIA